MTILVYKSNWWFRNIGPSFNTKPTIKVLYKLQLLINWGQEDLDMSMSLRLPSYTEIWTGVRPDDY